MGLTPSGQWRESRKARVRRRPVVVAPPVRTHSGGQEGTLWRRKMRTLAMRLSKRRMRRDRSGAPMKRG